ncbi:MAG: hypothetical protein RIR12_1594 [Bacteroidota bacterium]|jgi:hypothetical protein
MKKIFLIALMSFFAHHAIAQVKVGNNPTTIQADAVLDIESTNKGVLLPRMALTATTNPSPLAAHVAGMVIYNTATAGAADSAVVPGIYYNNGTKWFLSNQSTKGATEWRLGADTTVDAESDKKNIIYREGYVTLGDSLKLDTSAAFSVYKKSSVNPKSVISAQKVIGVNDDPATTTFQGAEISVYNKIAPSASSTVNGLRVLTKQGITARPGTAALNIRGIVNEIQGYSGTSTLAAPNGSWSGITGLLTTISANANVAGETYGPVSGNTIVLNAQGSETVPAVTGQNISLSGFGSSSKFPIVRTGLNINVQPSGWTLADTAREQYGITSTFSPTNSNKFGYGTNINAKFISNSGTAPSKELKGIYNELNYRGLQTAVMPSLTGVPMEMIAMHNVVNKSFDLMRMDVGTIASQKNELNMSGDMTVKGEMSGLINDVSYYSNSIAYDANHFPFIKGINNNINLSLQQAAPSKLFGITNEVSIVPGGNGWGYTKGIDSQYAVYNKYTVGGGLASATPAFSGKIYELAGVYSVLENKINPTATNEHYTVINKLGAYFENKTSGSTGERRITNNYGVKIKNDNGGGATIANSYGLHISGFGADANAPNSYAVFADGGASYFRDNVAVGVTGATTEKLEVNGAIKVANSNAATAAEGTIRYNATTKRFQGQIGVGQPGADANGWVDLH